MATVTHVVLPGQVIGEAESRARETVASFLRRVGWSTTTLPTICIINGAPVLRGQWRRRRIRKGDEVFFQSRPRGGGGGSNTTKSVMGLVGVIALAALAPGVGALAAGALQFSGAAGIASGAFIAGGGFLLNTLLSPTVASTQQTAQESLYTFGAQTNSARPLQTIPVKYGRVLSTPDYAAVPWSEFVGDDQYLHLLLVRGCGRYQPHQIRIDDTVLWTVEDGVADGFEGVEQQWCEPGEEVTLFPLNVAASVEVSGQELASTSIWVGGFVANAAGTSATALSVDLIWPQGLYIRNANGSYGAYLARTRVEYRPVSSLGLPTGAWSTLIVDERWGSSAKPLRASLRVEVPAGRYEVRARRDVPEGFSANAQDQVLWAGLRAALTGPRSFADVSVLAVRMKSTAQLTQASSGRFALLETRILPVWTGNGWSEQPTRNPGWAFLDAATNTAYGARRPLTKVDVQAAATLAATATARGDCFDYEFRDAGPAVDALDTILGSCRARTRWLGDVLSLVRDEWQALPSMMLTDREIVRGSFAVDYLFQSDNAADAVIVEYLDEETWRAEEVQVPADMVAQNPMRFQLKGVVQRAQASREGAFLWKQNTYRRVRPSLSTEHDGRLLSLGSTVTVQSEIPARWGQAGAVAWHVGRTLALDPAPSWAESGQHYMSLRTRTGRPFGPVKVARGASDAEAVLDAADLALVEGQQGLSLEEVLVRPNGGDMPSFALGVGTAWIRRAKVLSGSPDGDRVALSLVVDVPEVHDDSGDPGAVPPAAALSIPKAPLVAGLVASIEQNVLEPVLSASWWPAAGALYYIAQVSYDGRATWVPLAQAYAASLSVVVEPRALSLRVAAVGSGQGAWSVVDLDAPTIDADKLSITAKSFEEGLRTLVTQQFGQATDDIAQGLDTANTTLSELFASVQLLQMETAATVRRLPGAVQADVSERIITATGPTSLLAQQISTVITTTNTLGALVETNKQAQINGDQALANSLNTVAAQGTVNAAAITAEQSARQNADSAQTSTLNNHESRLGAAEGTLGSHGQSIASVASQTQTLVNTTSAQAGTLTNHESRLGSAEGTIGAHGQSISSVASQTQTLVNTTSSLTNTVNTQTSRLNAAEGTLGSHGQSLAAYGSQITTLSQQQQQTAGYAASIEAALNSTNAYINSTVTFKWLATATPAGATSAVELAAVANNHTAGLVIINDPTGSKIGLRAGRVVAMAEDGATKGLLDNSTGNLYIAGGMYAPSFVQTYHLGAYIITAEKLQLGAVVTDSIALAAVTNIVTQRRTATTTAANDVLWPSITRTPGTNLSIRLMLYFGAYTGATYGLPSEPSRWLVVRRWNGSVYADVASIVVRVMPKHIWFYNNVFSWSYGEHSAMFEFIDTDSVSGNVSYEILLLDSGGQYTGYPGGVGQRTIVLAESKR